jgi:dihydrofolate reductase
MRKLFSFMVVTLDGYYEGPDGEFDWPNVDDEFNEFAISQINDIDTLLFGRATYEGMASYWPTPEAVEDDPAITDRMNTIAKIVFSSTLDSADWQNTRLVNEGEAGVAETITVLKRQAGGDLALFGSPTLTASLIEQGLVDELRVMVQPILLGAGKSLFAALSRRVPVELQRTTVFHSGNVLLTYRPVG